MTTQEAAIIVAEFDGFIPHEKLSSEQVEIVNRSFDIPKGKKYWWIFCDGNCSGYDIEGLLRKYLSLDALVPVWERLNGDLTGYKNLCIETEHLDFGSDDGRWWRFGMNCAPKISRTYDSIQEAALIATAKAIQEIGK